MSIFIWDWDATLADTYNTINAAYAHTFRELNMSKQALDFASIKKITSSKMNKSTLEIIFGDKKAQAEKIYYNYINAHHLENLTPMPWAEHILQYCSQRGIKSYLFSSKTNIEYPQLHKEPFLTQEVKQLGFEKYFEKIIGAGEYSQDKPHPQACYQIFGGKEYLSQIKSPLYVVGDGRADIKVAEVFKQAGLQVSSILYNKENPENLTADYIISDLRQIEHIIDTPKS